HLTQAPEPLTTRRPDVPTALAAVIMKCLEKQPGNRWQSAGELLTRLEPFATPSALLAPAVKPIFRRTHWTSTRPVAAGVLLLAVVGVVGALGWLFARERPRANSNSLITAQVASGSRRNLFIVAQFTNQTTDSTYGALMGQALRDAIAGSPGLAFAGRPRINAALERMRLPENTPLTPAVARAIAVRELIKLVVEGSIARAGQGFVLSAQIVEPESGDAVHSAFATARDSTEILPAIERLSSDLRAGIGKSLGSIQATDQRHWSWTTSSLPAFQRALAATRSRSSGDYLRAIELDKAATALDPDLAHAYVGS